MCIRIVTFRNSLIQILANLFKNYFLSNIVPAKYEYVYSILVDLHVEHVPVVLCNNTISIIYLMIQLSPGFTLISLCFQILL